MNVRLYSSFTKRKNSTKQPDTGYTTLTCRLKSETGIESPTLVLSSSPAGNTYAYIPDFNRYYFIKNVTFTNGTYELTLESDPMATHKTEIGSLEGFILRCADTTFYNPKLTDPLNAPLEEITHKKDSTRIDKTAGNPLFTSGVGTFILTVMGKAPAGGAASDNGLARSYALTSTEMTVLGQTLLTTSIWQTLINEFTNPMDAIISCFYLPIPKSNLVTVQEDLVIGTQTIITNADLVYNRRINVSGDVSYAGAMPALFNNDYLVREPYATYSIYLPFVGMVGIDANILLEDANLSYEIAIDVFTGDLVYYLKSASGSKVGNYSGNCATGVPVGSQQMASALGIGGGLAAAIGGAAVGLGTLAAGGGLALGALGALGAGATAMFRSAQINTQTNGANSSSLGIVGGDSIEVHSFIKNPAFPVEYGKDIVGMMCRKFGQVSSHPGYLLMQNASVEIDTDVSSDIEEINNMLNSGFFYE